MKKIDELADFALLLDKLVDEGNAPEEVYFGIDPGVTTGVGVLMYSEAPKEIEDSLKPDYWISDQLSYGKSGNEDDVVDFGQYTEQWIAWFIGYQIKACAEYQIKTYVAIEDFILRPSQASNGGRELLSPVRITAGLQQEIFNISKVKQQFVRTQMFSASSSKSVVTNERLDKWGFKIKTQRDRHGRDGVRQAVLNVRNCIGNQKKYRISF